MSKHKFTREESSRGGRNGSSEAKSAAGHLGFEKTCETHPFFARNYLKHIIKQFNEKKKGPSDARSV